MARKKVEYAEETFILNFSAIRDFTDEQIEVLWQTMMQEGVNTDNVTKAVNFCKNLTEKRAKELDEKENLIEMFNLHPEMRKRSVNIILCNENAKIPLYATSHSAGADLYSANENGIAISAGARVLIPTGIKLELPQDAEAQVRPRSGLSLKHGLVAIFGTIDSDYQGEIGIILHNISGESKVIYKGERLAQLVFNGYKGLFQAEFREVKEFSRSSERGVGGFGSTGIKEVEK